MGRKKLSQLLEPSMRLYFMCLVAFAVISWFVNPYLAIAEGIALVVLFVYVKARNTQRKRDIIKYIESVTGQVDDVAKDTMINAPLPVMVFRPDNDEIVWSNDRFLQITGDREHVFDQKVADAVPDFSSRWLMEGKSQCPTDVVIEGRYFWVFGHMVHSEDTGGRVYLATTYWVEVTKYCQLREEYHAARPVCMILALDNYDEAMKGISDNEKSSMLVQINDKLDRWLESANGMLSRFDRDRYLFIFEERWLESYIEDKFSILDSIREVQNSAGLPVTLSIGIGKGADSLLALRQYAALSLDMALSRGGDQAVIKNKFNFEFYGGRAKEMEKRTKVKSRVMATALGALAADASSVMVMGHKFADMDSLGASVGVCAIARKRGVPAFIIIEPSPSPADDLLEIMRGIEEYQGMFLYPDQAVERADANTLLVVVDTNRPEQTISQNLLETCTKVAVIDHHRRAATYIANAALNFHEPYASSASELVAELAQYILEPADLLRVEAEAMLAGIVLDTKQFTVRTGSRTFDAAAFLRRAGANTGDVRKLFQSTLTEVAARYQIIHNARIYKNQIAVASMDYSVGRIAAAQAADELLNIAEIDCSFVLAPDDSGQIVISGRSTGDVNVQMVLEPLGGGGNAATAGAQISGKSVELVTRDLLLSIDNYTLEG